MRARNRKAIIASIAGIFALAFTAIAGQAWAQEGGLAAWPYYLQEMVTSHGEEMEGLMTPLHLVIFGIAAFVFVLLSIIILRFRASRNPNPSQTTHNTLLEIVWITIPVLILFGIGIPSLKILYAEDRTPPVDMTIKVTGNQWFWTYQYVDHGDFSFDSNMVRDDQLKPGQPRLLTADNPLVIPTGKTIRFLLTANDVLHAFAVPAFGVKKDTVPGRINESWAQIEVPGVYYGQCSELCGTNHAYMPIEIHAVTPEEFERWVAEARQKYAGLPQDTEMLAANSIPGLHIHSAPAYAGR